MNEDKHKAKKKFYFIPFVLSVLIPLLIGFLTNLLLPDIKGVYEQLEKPFFAPPPFLFPIVWTILYVLMGIASYIIYVKKYEGEDISSPIFVYSIQLMLNFLWSIIFFGLRLYGIALIELIILIIFAIVTIKRFYDRGGIKPALLLMPYFLWLIYAGVLNYYIWMLNEM